MSSPPLELVDEVVRAGAGAGKTTQLTARVLDAVQLIYSKEQRWPRIVVTTFTRKATQELRERLILKAVEKGDPELLQYVSSPSKLHISTIHGVLGLYLRQYGHLLGIDNSYSIQDDRETRRQVKGLMRDLVFESQNGEELLEVFNYERLATMLWQYFRASAEFSSLKLATAENFKAIGKTYHKQWAESLGDWIRRVPVEVKNDPKWQPYCDGLTRLGQMLQGDSWASATDLLEQLSLAGSKPRKSKNSPLHEEAHEEIQGIVKVIKTELAKPCFDEELWQQWGQIGNKFLGLSADFAKSFEKMKRETGQLEMADLELMTLKSLRQYPELGGAFADQWDYWLIDEYQDTSPLQVEILDQFVGSTPSFVVGDPQQSIYLFRGARSEVFIEREVRLENKGLVPQSLMKNYRSRPDLLEFINDAVTGLSPQFKAMEPREAVQKGAVDPVGLFFSHEKIESSKADGQDENPDDENKCDGLARGENEGDQAQARAPIDITVARRIVELRNKGVAFDQICVLVRKKKALVKIADCLNEYNIPTQVHGVSGFYDRREILDALALLKFMVNPHDNSNLALLLRSPWCRIPDDELVELCHKRKASIWSCLKSSEKQTEIHQRLNRIRAQAKEQGLTFTFCQALVDLGLMDLSHHHDSTGLREANLWKMVQRLHEAEKLPGFNILDFVEGSMNQLLDPDQSGESEAVAAFEPNRVNLMTVHASKGLQFEHVLIYDCGQKPELSKSYPSKPDICVLESQSLWSLRIPDKDGKSFVGSLCEKIHYDQLAVRELEEHERLFYVALTRAKDSVNFLWNSPAHETSWVRRLKLDLSSGPHSSEKGYSYEVLTGDSMPEALGAGQAGRVQLRDKYEARDDDQKHLQKFSVTSLLEDKNSSGSNAMGNSKKASAKIEAQGGVQAEAKGELRAEAHGDLQAEIPNWEIPSDRWLRASAEGVLVHRILESSQNLSREQTLKMAEDWFPNSKQQASKAIEYVLDLKELPMSQLIQEGQAEWGFQLKTKKGVLEGQIDLWGTVDGTTYVVDYKSGDPTYLDKAMSQLDLYAYALRFAGADGPIKRVVVYPFSQKVEIREGSDSEEIAETYEL